MPHPSPLGLGRVFDPEKRRQLIATAAPLRMARSWAANTEIDPRADLEVEFQGGMGRCAGESQSSCGERLEFIAGRGEKVKLSAMYSYLVGQRKDGLLGQDVGCTIRGSVQGAIEDGYCLHATFPSPDRYDPRIPRAAETEGRQHRARKHVVFSGYDALFNWLDSGVGVAQIGIDWTESCAQSTGVLETQTGRLYGGHALAALGFSRRMDRSGRKYIWVLNSHGLDYGNRGWIEVAPALFDRWGRDGRSELAGLTDLELFEPRDVSFVGAYR